MKYQHTNMSALPGCINCRQLHCKWHGSCCAEETHYHKDKDGVMKPNNTEKFGCNTSK